MILGYKDRRTELFASGTFVAAFQGFEKQAAKRAFNSERGTVTGHLEGVTEQSP